MNGIPSSLPLESRVARISSLLLTSTRSPALSLELSPSFRKIIFCCLPMPTRYDCRLALLQPEIPPKNHGHTSPRRDIQKEACADSTRSIDAARSQKRIVNRFSNRRFETTAYIWSQKRTKTDHCLGSSDRFDLAIWCLQEAGQES